MYCVIVGHGLLWVPDSAQGPCPSSLTEYQASLEFIVSLTRLTAPYALSHTLLHCTPPVTPTDIYVHLHASPC
jgi:hypothetical protein